MELSILFSALGVAGWWWLLRRHAGLVNRVPAAPWSYGDAIFAGTLAAIFVASAVMSLGQKTVVTPEHVRGAISFYVIIICVLCTVVIVRRESLVRIFGLAPSKPFHVLGIGVLCIVLVYPLIDLAGRVMGWLGHPIDADEGLVQYFREHASGNDLALAILMAVVVAPLTEELLFRGYLYGVLRKFSGRWPAMIVSAVIFAAAHPNVPAYPSLFLLAVALVLAFEITGSLWAPILMHGLFNFLSVAVILWFPEWIP